MRYSKTNDNAFCRKCNKQLNTATNLQNHKIEPGGISICVNCKNIARFDDDLLLIPLSKVELTSLRINHPLAWASIQHHINLIDNFIKTR